MNYLEIRNKIIKEIKVAFEKEHMYCDQVVWRYSQIIAVIDKYAKENR